MSESPIHFIRLYIQLSRDSLYHIKTSSLICRSNQCFYMIGTSVMKKYGKEVLINIDNYKKSTKSSTKQYNSKTFRILQNWSQGTFLKKSYYCPYSYSYWNSRFCFIFAFVCFFPLDKRIFVSFIEYSLPLSGKMNFLNDDKEWKEKTIWLCFFPEGS